MKLKDFDQHALRRLCRNCICYTVPGDPEGDFHILYAADCPAHRDALKQLCGWGIKFLNDEFLTKKS